MKGNPVPGWQIEKARHPAPIGHPAPLGHPACEACEHEQVNECPEDRTEDLVQRSESVICSKSVNSELQLVKRLRGGARGGGTTLQDLAVRMATRIGFCIKPGQPNPATGNCLIESAVFNINDRAELALFGQITDTILECRTLWVTQFQTQIPVFAPELNAFTEEQWDKIKRMEFGIRLLEI